MSSAAPPRSEIGARPSTSFPVDTACTGKGDSPFGARVIEFIEAENSSRSRTSDMELPLPGFFGIFGEHWTAFKRRGYIFQPNGTLVTAWDWFLYATVCAQLSKNSGSNALK